MSAQPGVGQLPGARARPMPPAGLADATALELAALLRRREISAAEAAEASIAAVEAVNPLLNAVIRFDPDRVRAEAGLADERLGRGDTGTRR